MTRNRYLGIALCMSLISVFVPAQQSGDLAASADTAYRKKDWATAKNLYSQLSRSDTSVPRYWYRLGFAAQALGEHQKALDAFERAKAKGSPAFVTDYNIACVYASMGQTDRAFINLNAAIKAGFAQPEQMSSDSDLQTLTSDTRFHDLLEQARHNQTPCDYIAENRQFDFWVGEWNVVSTAGGHPQGSSHIEKELGDCVIWENWKSLGNTRARVTTSTIQTSSAGSNSGWTTSEA